VSESDLGVVRAAGGVVVRDEQVLLVHRPRYDDWSFPKGKREGDETDEETALREVVEETGLACGLGPELGEARYRDHRGRPKIVRYWLMTAASEDDGPGFVPGDEVDEVRWCAFEDAATLLTYPYDRDLLTHLRSQR
jgi:8-oxo-dGTP diphosphatase